MTGKELSVATASRSLAVNLIRVASEVVRLFDPTATSVYVRASYVERAAVTEAELHALAAAYLSQAPRPSGATQENQSRPA